MTAQIICGETSFSATIQPLVQVFTLFRDDASLLSKPYSVQSAVSPDAVREVLAGLEGEVLITTANADELSLLCNEFGYRKLKPRIEHFLARVSAGVYFDFPARNSIAELEQIVLIQGRELASLQRALAPLTDRAADFERMRALLHRVASDFAPKLEKHDRDMAAIDRKLTGIDGHTRDISQLRDEISRFKEENSTTQQRQMLLEQEVATGPAPPPIASARVDSVILSSIPLLLNEFAGKRWQLLYRGSRDGYRAQDFHRRCDNRGPTLTVIADVDKYVFGGYTPIAWSSPPTKTEMYDREMTSFLFSLRNSWNLLPQKFPLRPEGRNSAIICYAGWGPTFGNCDLCVCDKSNQARLFASDNTTENFGTCYRRTIPLVPKAFFTKEKYFQVGEIEVFAIG
jgi:hypothetical protein